MVIIIIRGILMLLQIYKKEGKKQKAGSPNQGMVELVQ